MKYMTFLISIVFVSTTFATELSRSFICSAEDTLGRLSALTFNVEARTITMKAANDPSAPSRILYDANTSCGLKVTGSKKCETRFNHNLDQPNKPYPAMNGTIRCTAQPNRPIHEQSGSFEINRFGDGTGFFDCGKLSRHDLALHDCSLVGE